MEQPTQKIHIIGERVVLVGTGEVGLDQRFAAIVQSAWEQDAFQKTNNAIDLISNLSRHAIQHFQHTFINPGAIPYGALVAFPFKHELHLCEFQVQTFQPELKDQRIWYVSMGLGQAIGDPFLSQELRPIAGLRGWNIYN